MTFEAMCRICTLNYRAQLGIADASFHARRAHGTGANSHFNYVRPRQDQFFYHLAGHHVARLQKSISLYTLALLLYHRRLLICTSCKSISLKIQKTNMGLYLQ